MKRKITLLGVVGITAISSLLLNTNTNLIANSGGSVGGYSNSVGDNGNSCGQGGCHGGGHIVDLTGYIITDIPVGGYVPGNTYTISVTGPDRGKSKFGFELSAEDNAGNTLGSLTPSVSGREQLKANGQVTHTNSGNTVTGGSFGWQASWVAPNSGAGDVTFSTSVLFANGNGNNSGDSTRVSSLTIGEDATTNINDKESDIKKLYPNPVVNELNIELSNNLERTVSIINSAGKVVKKVQMKSSFINLDLSDLTKGVYVVSVDRNGAKFTQAFIKK